MYFDRLLYRTKITPRFAYEPTTDDVCGVLRVHEARRNGDALRIRLVLGLLSGDLVSLRDARARSQKLVLIYRLNQKIYIARLHRAYTHRNCFLTGHQVLP